MKYRDLEKHMNVPVFSRQDLLLQGLKVYDYQLTLWVKKGNLLRLKKGVFAFARDKETLKKEEIAYRIYQPSYISLESALSHYGFIPEIVYACTSLTSKINRTFDNYFGRFLYRHIKRELFWGYSAMQTENGLYLMVEPEKALLDYLYLNLANLQRQADLDNIRLNREQIAQQLDVKKFKKYLSAFGIKKMEKWALKCLP